MSEVGPVLRGKVNCEFSMFAFAFAMSFMSAILGDPVLSKHT